MTHLPSESVLGFLDGSVVAINFERAAFQVNKVFKCLRKLSSSYIITYIYCLFWLEVKVVEYLLLTSVDSWVGHQELLRLAWYEISYCFDSHSAN